MDFRSQSVLLVTMITLRLMIVNRVLDSHDLSRIQKFHLHCDDDYFESPPVDRWIHAAIERKVVELDLCVNHSEQDQNF